MSREKTNIKVKVLDLDPIKEQVKVHFSSSNPFSFDPKKTFKPKNVKIVDIFFRGKIGLVGTTKGVYVVNEKGSGMIDPIILGRPYEFDTVDIHFFNENSLEHFIKNFRPIVYPLTKLQELPIVEVVDLADFILVGDSRDKNFRVWKEILEGSPSTLF